MIFLTIGTNYNEYIILVIIQFLNVYLYIFQCIWSLIMLFTGGLLQFMEYISLYATYMGLNVTLALLYYRWKAPDVHRPYKVGHKLVDFI